MTSQTPPASDDFYSRALDRIDRDESDTLGYLLVATKMRTPGHEAADRA